MQLKPPLFTSDSQHPPRFRHAVYLGEHVCPLFVCSELSLKTAHEHLSTYPKSANRDKSRLLFSSAEMCKKPI